MSTGEKKKRHFKKVKPSVDRRWKPRRKQKDDDSLRGEYTTWKMLHVLTWLKAMGYEHLMVKAIAKGCSMTEAAAAKTLRLLRARHLVECIKPKKRVEKRDRRVHHPDFWILTVAGEKHWKAEMRFRTFTKRFDDLAKGERYRILLHDVETVRLKIVPRIMTLSHCPDEDGREGHEIYRIDRLIQTRPVKYLLEALDMAKKAKNPAAYFVACCLGNMREAVWKRTYALIAKHPFWMKNQKMTAEFVEYLTCLPWVDPFAAALFLTPVIQGVVKMTGGVMDSKNLSTGVTIALGMPKQPRRYATKVG